MVEIFIAVAAATTGTSQNDRAALELADNSIHSRIHRCGVFSDVGNVTAVRRNQDVLV
jgi:hypothetical protein